MTVTEFLLARIAEDEALVHATDLLVIRSESPWSPARVLAKCEADRQIVEQADRITDDSHLQDIGWQLLHTLASVYVDHPDYRPEWSCAPKR